jgi:hypothetical protein
MSLAGIALALEEIVPSAEVERVSFGNVERTASDHWKSRDHIVLRSRDNRQEQIGTGHIADISHRYEKKGRVAHTGSGDRQSSEVFAEEFIFVPHLGETSERDTL